MRKESADRLKAAFEIIDRIGLDEYVRLRVLSEPIPQKLANKLSRELYSQEGLEKLTNRERQVITLLLAGQTKKEIAAQLGITFETVKAHVKRIHLKLGCKNRIELFRKAVERGWLIDGNGSDG